MFTCGKLFFSSGTSSSECCGEGLSIKTGREDLHKFNLKNEVLLYHTNKLIANEYLQHLIYEVESVQVILNLE